MPRMTPFQLQLTLYGKSYLFPNNTTLSVIDIVDLIEDDPLNVPDDVSTLVQHGPQDLCCHDEAC